jgi:hypothetical protein
MKTIYVADDGRQFDCEDECEAYENKKKIAAMNLQSRFFDNDGKLMDITDLYKCVEEGWYMEITSTEEAEFLAEYAKREASIILFPRRPCAGRFYWDTDSDEWRNMKELYATYMDKMKVFEG